MLGDWAHQTGLTRHLSVALSGLNQRQWAHDRGQVLLQLALAIADGATTLSDAAVLRHQPALFGAGATARPCGGPWRPSRRSRSPTWPRPARPPGNECGRPGWTRGLMSSILTAAAGADTLAATLVTARAWPGREPRGLPAADARDYGRTGAWPKHPCGRVRP